MFYENITLEDCYNNCDVCEFVCDGDSKIVAITYIRKDKRNGDR